MRFRPASAPELEGSALELRRLRDQLEPLTHRGVLDLGRETHEALLQGLQRRFGGRVLGQDVPTL